MQIIEKKFGYDSITYGGHGYAGSKSGYTEAHAIDIYPIGKVGQMAEGKDRAKGDEMVAFIERNWQAFGVKNIIWWRKINTSGTPDGWKYYDHAPYMRSGKGSPDEETQMHGDHIHIQMDKDGRITTYED